ncbi:MAG: glycosyltransferase [Leptolyngbyaceae cyanobacterium CSU_1_4]|nr:glycosyltransferase [Leptolyngbyaceae cyanobacterium CSU_1_4]
MTILMYHKVDLVNPTMWWVTVDQFYRQMRELRGKQVVYLDDYEPRNPNQVVITFDGIYKNILQYAAPILQEFNYPFELFLSSDFIGGNNEFDAVEPLADFADLAELKKLTAMNGRLQWHTRSHRDLSNEIAAEIEIELQVPEEIRQLDFSGFKWFAYPYGNFNSDLLQQVKNKFIGAVSCHQGNDIDRHCLNRLTVTNDTKLGGSTIAAVITSYNYGAFLTEAIESVLRQTRLPDEILISDDASTDDTYEIATLYQEKYPDLIKVNRNEENLGIVNHFNKAVKLTNADYVAILGADNRFRSDYLDKTSEILDLEPEVAIAYTDFALFGNRAHLVFQDFPQEWRGEIKLDRFFIVNFPNFDEVHRQYLLETGNFIHGSSMFRRKAFMEVGGYVSKSEQPEDYGLFQRIVKAGWQAKRSPLPLLEYRQHSKYQANIQLTSYGALQLYKGQVRDYQAQIQGYQAQISQYGLAQEQLQKELAQSQTELTNAQIERQRTQAYVQQVCAEFDQLQTDSHHLRVNLSAVHAELHAVRASVADSHEQVRRKQTKIEELRTKIQRLRVELERTQTRLIAVESSKFWKLRKAWFKLKRLFGVRENDAFEAPTDSLGSAPSQEVSAPPQPPAARSYNPTLAYELWMQQHTPTAVDLQDMANLIKIFAKQPRVSVVMPVYNPTIQFLREAIESVLAQVYSNWELCIADDASLNPLVRETLEEYANQDERIRVVFRTENGHISRASNSALEVATGEFIALLDHDDVLAPEALYEMVLMLNKHPEADMIYSDEDKIDAENRRKFPFFKPDWCPDSFLSRMYTCHLGFYRRSLITEIGGFRVGFEGSQDYDLVLRLTEKTNQIFHIPKILYHWRIHEHSASSGAVAKPYAYEAGQRAIAEALERRGEPGQVTEIAQHRGHYIVRYDIKTHDLVSIIIPTRDLGRFLNQCLESIFENSTYPNYEVILVDNGSTEPYTEKVISDWLNREPNRFRCYSYGIPFNYSKLNNYGVSKASGKYLLFLNNDTEVIAPDWIEAMVEHSQRSSIGAVGARLLYSDNTIQHAGVILGIGGVGGHLHKCLDANATGHFDRLVDTLNYSAVTAACLMCRREVFEAAGGFNEDLAVAFNDVEFCLKILRAGFRNICLPHAKLYHHESKSRGYEDTPEKKLRFNGEIAYIRDRWSSILDHDPCYSPHLSLKHEEECRIRETEESQVQLELTIQLRQSKNTLKRVRDRLNTTQEQLEQVQGKVAAMETSKFWKIRQQWFQIKQVLRLSSSVKEREL